ncbi:hypothetical protein BGX33_004054 [Mortierella sp. NVP41]|nr:hypothetical protein BGX33_004054 [Mortierella sp. NVP41]
MLSLPANRIDIVNRIDRAIDRGFQCPHAPSVLHRNIKPQDMLASKNGAKLGDLGLAIGGNDEEKGWAGTLCYCASEMKRE